MSRVAQVAGAHAASRRLARLARDASQTSARLLAELDADVVATVEVPAGQSVDDVAALIAEASADHSVTVVVTRATTAP